MDTASVTLPPFILLPKKQHSSVRFLIKLPDSNTDTAPELDEIWPSDNSDPTYFPDSDSEPEPVYPSSRCGLSALLAEDRIPGVRRPTRPFPSRIGSGAGPDTMGRSAPVNVPTWRHVRSEAADDVEQVEDGDDEDEMAPPHVIAARSHVTTFSVFEGVGRTLKGRDLRRVRNAVFEKTGFLD